MVQMLTRGLIRPRDGRDRSPAEWEGERDGERAEAVMNRAFPAKAV